MIFQSHIGAIRIIYPILGHNGEEEFQSHIGAIRIQDDEYIVPERYHFNPTLVQLEFDSATLQVLRHGISIPHWCN